MSPKMVAALFVVAGAVVVTGMAFAAYVVLPEVLHGTGNGCDLHAPHGLRALTPADETEETHEQQGRWQVTRTLTYHVQPGDALDLHACTDVGRLEVVAADVDRITVVASVTGQGETEEGAREAAQRLEPDVRAEGDGTGLAAREPHVVPAFGRDQGAVMRLRVEVPATLSVAATLRTDVGTLSVEGARLTMLDAGTDTGKLRLDPGYAEGRISAHTDVGSLEARFPALGEAQMRIHTDVGAVKLWVPATDRHGYDIHAHSDLGRVTLDLPDLEDQGGSGQAREARSAGYDARDVKVTVQVWTDLGGIEVHPV